MEFELCFLICYMTNVPQDKVIKRESSVYTLKSRIIWTLYLVKEVYAHIMCFNLIIMLLFSNLEF
jgi:hypothetical protein